MKVAAVFSLALCLSGCLVDMLMTTAITADMAAQEASSATGVVNQAELETAQYKLQDALEYYYAEKESYPASLDALVPTYIEAIPTRPDGEAFGYNPVEGAIYVNNKGPSPEDYLLMEAIKAAIQQFGTATGFYPPTLDDLYPNYLPRLPRTTSGVAFGYDNQNGRVTHPNEGLQYAEETGEPTPDGGVTPVKPVNAVGALKEGDLKDSNSLNKSLDRLGY